MAEIDLKFMKMDRETAKKLGNTYNPKKTAAKKAAAKKAKRKGKK